MKHAPQDRYEVQPVGQGYAIRDMSLRAFCGLGGPPLAFATREDARAWLTRCYGIWGTSPAVGEEPPERDDWARTPQPFREASARSPWEGYTAPLYP